MKKFPTLLECVQARQALLEIEISHLGDCASASGMINKMNDLKSAFVRDIKAVCEFYSQPLALWMYIPMAKDKNGHWQILAMPKPSNYSSVDGFTEALICFEDAEKRVLFKGWSVKSYVNIEVWEIVNCLRGLYSRGGRIRSTCIRNVTFRTVYEVTNDTILSHFATQSAINLLKLEE